MNSKELEDQIIAQYRKDEKMMILVFAQWCVNHDLNPKELYYAAYPNQKSNAALEQALELTVPKEESGFIATDTLLNLLSVFGNEDLAFIVSEHASRINKK